VPNTKPPQRRFRLLSPVEFQCLTKQEKLLYVKQAFTIGVEIDSTDGALVLQEKEIAHQKAMRFSIQNFEREREGVWKCIRPGAFLLPDGAKIEVAPGTVLSQGTVFMGVELARMLEEQYQAEHGRQAATRKTPRSDGAG